MGIHFITGGEKKKKTHYYSPSSTSHTVYCRLTTSACLFLPRQAKLKSSVKMDLDRDGGAWTVPPQALQIVAQKHATNISSEPGSHAFLGNYCSSAPGESLREETRCGAVTAVPWLGWGSDKSPQLWHRLPQQNSPGSDHGYAMTPLLLPNGI